VSLPNTPGAVAAAVGGQARGYARTRRRSVGRQLLLGAIGLGLLLGAWEVGAVITSHTSDRPEVVWPSLEYIAGTAFPEIGAVGQGFESAGAGEIIPADPNATARERGGYRRAVNVLAEQSRITVTRVLVGTLIGALIGVAMGLILALSKLLRRMIYPTVNLLRQIPLLALSLLFLVWFGGADRGIYVYVVFGVSTMLMLNTINAVRNVPDVQFAYARTLGAGRLHVIRTVILPAIVPEVLGGLKVAVGLAWAMVLAAEYLGTQAGLGRLMLFFELFAFTGRMAVVIATFVFWAVVVHLLLSVVSARVTRWVPRT
jgi:ABC-type nitrate/sulfonate/bicarbonate transport system permease component